MHLMVWIHFKLLSKNKNTIFYYVASGENDLSGHKSVNEFDKQFAKIENEYFNYEMFDTKNNQATIRPYFPSHFQWQ